MDWVIGEAESQLVYPVDNRRELPREFIDFRVRAKRTGAIRIVVLEYDVELVAQLAKVRDDATASVSIEDVAKGWIVKGNHRHAGLRVSGDFLRGAPRPVFVVCVG